MAKSGNSTRDAISLVIDSIREIYPAGEARAIALIVVTHITGLTGNSLLADPHRPVGREQWDKINKICGDLKNHKPVQYVLGETSFFGLRLKVNEHTLIPRQETEELVDLVIRENNSWSPSIIDIGTGSGSIAISLSVNMPAAGISATDISGEALKVAAENCRINQCRVDFFKEDIMSPSYSIGEPFDIIVSNPPYVRESEKENMNLNVTGFEPHGALFVPDNDPLLFYRAIAGYSVRGLAENGKIYLEINESLGKETSMLLSEFGFRQVRVICDLNGRERIIAAVK